MAANRPIILPACSPSDMISYALQHPSSSTTILICGTRSAFLNSLASSVDETPDNHLLHANLDQIACSRSIALAFLPTISHLRAYLAVFQPKPEVAPHVQTSARTLLLLVYGLLNLHRDTSEWSAQGLGITVASLVESGSRHGFEIVMCEEDVKEDVEESVDVIGAVSAGNEELQRDDVVKKGNCWKEEMPMLNGSTRRLVSGADETTGWAGRTVEVGRVLQRWCLFQDG